ncbi:MAG: hypothetical protein FJ184_14500 [Gammaproteobacteria bacterium]|nr:hypothetical protein [Gammaproteobacteria bacterium]
MAREKDWGPGGYDRTVMDRWLYAVANPETRVVKVGMVLDEERLAPRLNEIRRKQNAPHLEMIAKSVVPNVDHEETEHIESTVRLWLTRAKGFSFVGEVDWLAFPTAYDPANMQRDLDDAIRAAINFGL